MNEILYRVLKEFDQKLVYLEIDFHDPSWRVAIPPGSGWYLVKTNAPLPVLASVNAPDPEHKAHIDIPRCIDGTSALRSLGLAIAQSGSKDYVVYSGEADDLKARAREHECGHGGTYCLGLSKYQELREYRWSYCYVTASSCNALTDNDADKLLRIAVEQGWRAKHGWPILCHR